MTFKTIMGTGCALAMLAACGQRDVILPGERLDIRDGMATQQVETANVAAPIPLGAQVANADWTHRGGSATHNMPHLALSDAPTLAFAASIGQGDSRRNRITADPIVVDGVIYTIDSAMNLAATATNGASLWSVSLIPAGEQSELSGAALAYGGGMIFATTAFGELIALSPANGGVIWRQDLGASGASAPTYQGGVVYVVGQDNRAWAIDAENGKVRYTKNSNPVAAQYGYGPGVAVTGEYAIFPFSSGQLIGAFKNGGLNRWTDSVGGERLGYALNALDGITAGPVVDGSTVYYGNSTGMIVALNLSDGTRRWSAQEGAVNTVYPVGGSVFAVNDINELVRIDARTGDVVWTVQMPDLIERRMGKSRAAVAHYGPVVAGGHVIVASSDGALRMFDPVSGALARQIELPSGAASAPVVAGGVLYVVNKDGQLLAFR